MRKRVFKAIACLAFAGCLATAGCDVSTIGEEVGATVRDSVKGAVVDIGTVILEAAVETWFE